jgi:hypothetical protein
MLLASSALVYIVGWRFDLNIPTWDGSGWGFDPLEWQALFTIGLLAGYRARESNGEAVRIPAWLPAVCLVFLIGARAMQLLQTKPDIAAHAPGLGALAHMLEPYFPVAATKGWLHPLRLVSVLALAILFRAVVARDAGWLKSRPSSPFVLMGQHSLTVFCAGVPVSFLTRVVLDVSADWTTLIVVNVAGFAIMLLVAWVAARLESRNRDAGPISTAGRTLAAAPVS